jgi:hypothetical protein
MSVEEVGEGLQPLGQQLSHACDLQHTTHQHFNPAAFYVATRRGTPAALCKGIQQHFRCGGATLSPSFRASSRRMNECTGGTESGAAVAGVALDAVGAAALTFGG